MARFGGYGRGDLYVEWDVRTPEENERSGQETLEDLKRIGKPNPRKRVFGES